MSENIKATILRRLPFGKFVRFETTKDMAGNEIKDAIVWAFYDGQNFEQLRKAYFHPETAEYIGEKDL